MMSLCYIVENFFVLKKHNPIHQPRNLVMLYKRVRVVLHEIAFLKFHFLLEVIMHNFHIIMSRRKWNFKKAISHSEPLKWGRILILGSKWKFNFLPKMGKNFLCTVYRNLCKWHSFLCSVHRKLICPYFAIGYQLTQPEICREHYFCNKKKHHL